MNEINLIGGFYKSKSLPFSAQDVVNWLPVPSKSEGSRSPIKLRGLPGLKPLGQEVVTGLTISGDAPDTLVGATYSYTYSAAGGTPPYVFSQYSGTLPAGLTFSSAGTISGTPTTAQVSDFGVRVADAGDQVATLDDRIVVSLADEVSINQHTFSRDGLSSTTVAVAIPGTPAVGDAVFVFEHTAATQVSGIMPVVSMTGANGVPGLSGTGVGGVPVITGFQVSSNGVGSRTLTSGDVSAGTIDIILPAATAVYKSVVTIIKISAGNFGPLTTPPTVETTFGLNPAALSYTPSAYGFTFVMHTGGASVASWPLALERKSAQSAGSTGNNGQAVFVAVSYEKLVSGSSFDPASYTLSSAPSQGVATSAHLIIKRP